MKQIILDEKGISHFENLINSFPCFPKNVAETMAVSQAVNSLMQFMHENLVDVQDSDPKPIGGGSGGAGNPKP